MPAAIESVFDLEQVKSPGQHTIDDRADFGIVYFLRIKVRSGWLNDAARQGDGLHVAQMNQ